MTKTTEEEFKLLKPRCSCYEHELIPWKPKYRYTGIPKCLKGHGTKKKNVVTKEEFERTGPHYCSCERRCGREIKWKEHYKYRGIPKYLHGHNAPLIGKPLSEKQRENMSISRKGQVPWIKGKHHTPESNQKNREKHLGIKPTEETIQKRIKTYKQNNSGENSPFYGKPLSVEHKQNISQSNIGKHNIKHTTQTKDKIRCSLLGKYSGENNPNWQGGISFEPYCEKFNEKRKEEVRNKYSRTCLFCGLDEKYNLTKTNKIRKLSVHHIDGDKEQGCKEKKWELVPLCMKCHGLIKPNNIKYWMQYIKDTLRLYNIRDVWNWWD